LIQRSERQVTQLRHPYRNSFYSLLL